MSNDLTKYIQNARLYWSPTTTTMPSISLHGGGLVGTPKPNNDYSGFDLALGEVYGLRLWRVDSLGRLRARNWDDAGPWKPGVNVARCLATYPPPSRVDGVIDPTGQGRKAVNVTADRYSFSGDTEYTVSWDDGSMGSYTTLKFTEGTDGRHAAPSEDCKCGFYAYTDVEHSEIDSYREDSDFVLGVIKGTGRTLIGTRGFRCEKAEVVALRDPIRGGKKTSLWRRNLRKKIENVYPDVPLLDSRSALLEFADIETQLPDPASDEFWSLP